MSETVLITGAAGGIGSAAARLFAEKGCGLVLCCHSVNDAALELLDSVRSLGARAQLAACDVADSAGVAELFDFARAHFGGVDILINNAGVSSFGLLTDMTDGDYDKIFDVNVRGVFNCCRAALPEMIRRRSGAIVNVSSMWGLVGASCEALYSASKAAVIGLTKSLAKEAAPSGVRVNCAAPGVIDTPMNSRLSPDELAEIARETPLGRLGTPDEAARVIYFLASDDSSFVTGQTLSVDGGFTL